MNIETIGIALACIAVAAAAGVIIRAVFISRRKRRRLAAAYDYDATDRTERVVLPRQRPEWPPPPPLPTPNNPASFAPPVRLGLGGAPGREWAPVGVAHPALRTDTRVAARRAEKVEQRRADEGFSVPSMPADPGPVLFAEPVSLSSPSFEGHGGASGGAGASGSWDAPQSTPDSSPSCSVDSSPSIDCTPTSSDP